MMRGSGKIYLLVIVTIGITALIFIHTPPDVQHIRSLVWNKKDFLDSRYSPYNQFVYSNVVDEPVDTVWNSTLAEILGVYGDGSCSLSPHQVNLKERLKKILSYWRELAEQEQIPYFLTYGSLLGYVRNKDVMPYDYDLDVFLPSWAYEKLVKHATPTPVMISQTFEVPILLLQPDTPTRPIEERRAFDCDGKVIEYAITFCRMKYHVGRVGLQYDYLDLFPFDHDPQFDIAFFPYPEIVVTRKLKYFFPLRPCTFMDIRVLCPNDPMAFLLYYYGPRLSSLLPDHLCSNGTFWSRREAPELHQEWRTKWEQRVGPDIAKERFHTSDFSEYSNKEFCLRYPQDNKYSGICNFSFDQNS